MNNKKSYFYLGKVAESHALDDVQTLLIGAVEKQFDELWPSTLRPPDALNDLFIAVATLIDWTSRNPRGRAAMRKRILKLVATMNREQPTYGTNSLLEHVHAAVVPGIVAALLAEEQAEICEVECGDLVERLDAWLAAGGDSQAV